MTYLLLMLSIVFLHLILFCLCKRFKHSDEIFPPNTWVETINSTLDQNVQANQFAKSSIQVFQQQITSFHPLAHTLP